MAGKFKLHTAIVLIHNSKIHKHYDLRIRNYELKWSQPDVNTH